MIGSSIHNQRNKQVQPIVCEVDNFSLKSLYLMLVAVQQCRVGHILLESLIKVEMLILLLKNYLATSKTLNVNAFNPVIQLVDKFT